MEHFKEISEYIKAGKKIQAVKLIKDSTGFSLKEAKEYADNLEIALKNATDKPKQMHHVDKPKQMHYVSSVSAVDGMEGHQFEYFCADLLRKVGFLDVSVTPGSGDQGVDILAVKDGIKYAIQCKNYASTLGNTPVQEVSAGKQFYSCHVGVVMTNSTFTPGAIQLAAATNVLLWDRSKLDDLIIKAGGLENLGLCPECDDIDIIDDVDEIDVAEDNVVITNEPPQRSTQVRRTGMKILSRLCLGWSIICVLLLLLMLGVKENRPEYFAIIFGEGLFTLILGLMFGALSKTKKHNPYMFLGMKSVKKSTFVITCIVIAYALFLGTIGIAIGLSPIN